MVEKIDLRNYQTDELAEQLAELISAPAAIGRVFLTTLLFTVVAIAGGYAIHSMSEMAWLSLLCLYGYSIVLGIVFGFLLGIMRVISRLLGSLEAVLILIFDMTNRVARDYDQIQAGEAQMPSGRELVEQVLDQIILPAAEKAVAKNFGILSAPLLWIYRLTIAKAVRAVLKKTSQSQLTDDQEKKIESAASSGMATAAKYSDGIAKFTSSASKMVHTIGRALHFYAMLPLYILFGVSLLLATIPMWLLWYFAG